MGGHGLQTEPGGLVNNGRNLIVQRWMDQVFGPLRNSKYMEYAKDINQASTHLLEIISDILELSKIEVGEAAFTPEETSLTDIVEYCMSILKQQAEVKGINLQQSVLPDTSKIWADRNMLKQILFNIIGNSIKFTNDGGLVRVETDLETDGTISITVSDTGVGIPADSIATAVEPFGQVRDSAHVSHEGTGLGLPLAKQRVELHGGVLSIESEVGMGTSVKMTFPQP